MSRPMTKQEWLSYIEQTWNAAQKEAWSEQPRREWVGLTDEDKQTAVWTNGTFGAGALWADAKLKEKNT